LYQKSFRQNRLEGLFSDGAFAQGRIWPWLSTWLIVDLRTDPSLMVKNQGRIRVLANIPSEQSPRQHQDNSALVLDQPVRRVDTPVPGNETSEPTKAKLLSRKRKTHYTEEENTKLKIREL